MMPLPPDKHREATLRAALGFLAVTPAAPELQLLHRWLDTWNGIGLPAVDGEWRCYFSGNDRLLAPQGYGVAATPWRAVQRAAWAVVHHGCAVP